MMPTMTVRIAITIATIGRLMKNSEIMALGLSYRRWLWLRKDKGLRIDDHVRSDFLQALGNDCFTRLQAVFDNPLRAAALANLDRPNAYFVSAADDSNLVATLQLNDRALGYEQCAFSDFRHRPDPSVLSRPQLVCRVGEHPSQPDGPGLRIDLAIYEKDSASPRIDVAVG